MSDKNFVSGLYVKSINTKYGDIIKLSINVDEFTLNAQSHIKIWNGKKYLNIDVLTNREGKKYAAYDDYEKESAPRTETEPESAPETDNMPF